MEEYNYKLMTRDTVLRECVAQTLDEAVEKIAPHYHVHDCFWSCAVLQHNQLSGKPFQLGIVWTPTPAYLLWKQNHGK